MKNPVTLLVEDDDNDVFFFKRAMKEVNWNGSLQVARDGVEAIAYLEGTGVFADRGLYPSPDLVVLDLKLPVKTGLEVLEWYREHAPESTVPVVVFTSSTSDADLRQAYRLGANSCLNKPTHPDEMVRLVEVFKLYWLRYNRVPHKGA